MSIRARALLAVRLGLTGLVLLAAGPVLGASPGKPAPAPAPATRAECEATGGRWDDVSGRGHVTGCNPPTSDGGKECTDSDQCQGACQRGTCSTHRSARGCGIIEHGKVLCID